MARKARSGMTNGYVQYNSVSDSMVGLGYGTGGTTDQWEGSLDDDEYQAVEDYSGDYYEELNEALREGRPFETGRHYYDDDDYDYDALDANLEAAINKFELTNPTVFTRGSSADLLGGASTVEEINAMKGNVVSDPGYTSSSASTGESFGGDIIYHVQTPAGKGIGAYVVGISVFGESENEFLFNKGSAFKIAGAYKDSKGQVHCNLDYVGRM